MIGRTNEPTLAHEQLAIAVEIMPDPVLVYDQDARIVLVNAHLVAATGHAAAELVGQHALTLMPESLRDALAPRMAAYLANPVRRSFGDGLESTFVRKDGSTFEAQIASTPVRSSTGVLVVGMLRDVTDLSLEDIRFRGLVESSPDATFILSAARKVMLSNSRAARLFGRQRVELFDEPVEALFPDHHADTLIEWLHECLDAFLDGTFADAETHTIELTTGPRGGSSVPVELSVGPMQTAQGLMLRLVVRDISERVQLQLEADRMKNDFLATVSHELRTPLTSILGYGELLEDLAPPHLDARAHGYVEVISRNARRELRLVDDLLTMVQIEDGGLSVRPAHIDLCRVVQQAVEAAEPIARDARVDLSFTGARTKVLVLGDADRLGQALDALVSNAIKFSPAGGAVTIGMRTTPDAVTVAVSDTGPGIPDGDIANVFERLYRGENAIVAHIPGAGIGLSIVRSIIEAHQGTVSATNNEAGACFEITLPRAGGQRLPDSGLARASRTRNGSRPHRGRAGSR